MYKMVSMIILGIVALISIAIAVYLSLPKPVLTCEQAKALYLINNIDVKNARMDPWSHYVRFGRRETRKWKGIECK